MTRLWAVVAALFAASVVVDLVIGANVPGLFAALGFFGCVLLVFGSKWLGRALLQRREDYYEGGGRA